MSRKQQRNATRYAGGVSVRYLEQQQEFSRQGMENVISIFLSDIKGLNSVVVALRPLASEVDIKEINKQEADRSPDLLRLVRSCVCRFTVYQWGFVLGVEDKEIEMMFVINKRGN